MGIQVVRIEINIGGTSVEIAEIVTVIVIKKTRTVREIMTEWKRIVIVINVSHLIIGQKKNIPPP